MKKDVNFAFHGHKFIRTIKPIIYIEKFKDESILNEINKFFFFIIFKEKLICFILYKSEISKAHCFSKIETKKYFMIE